MSQTTYLEYNFQTDQVLLRTAPSKKGRIRYFTMAGQLFEVATKRIDRNWAQFVGTKHAKAPWEQVSGTHKLNPGGTVEVSLLVGESGDPRVLLQDGNSKTTFDLELFAKNPKKINVHSLVKNARATKKTLSQQVL